MVDSPLFVGSAWVLYRSDSVSSGSNNLYANPTSRVMLNPALAAGQSVSNFRLSPTGVGVVCLVNDSKQCKLHVKPLLNSLLVTLFAS
jgi:hypothetical protein